MRKYKLVLLAAMMASVTAAAAGCSGGGGTSAPNVTLATVAAADHTVEDDGTEAAVELLSLQSPIEFCYSYYNTDMLFVMEDGKWTDMMVPETPINQEMFNSMADKFLNLKAIEKVENPKTMEEYNMDYPAYSLYLTDGEKGAVEITIGDQDENGNYYNMDQLAAKAEEEGFDVILQTSKSSEDDLLKCVSKIKQKMIRWILRWHRRTSKRRL